MSEDPLRGLPNIDFLNKRVDECVKHGTTPFRPGPLEGNLRPMNQGPERVLLDDEVNDIISKLQETPNEIPWPGLENASAMFFL